MTEEEYKREWESFQAIINSLEKSVKAHRTFLDGWLYNVGTVATLSADSGSHRIIWKGR